MFGNQMLKKSYLEFKTRKQLISWYINFLSILICFDFKNESVNFTSKIFL